MFSCGGSARRECSAVRSPPRAHDSLQISWQVLCYSAAEVESSHSLNFDQRRRPDTFQNRDGDGFLLTHQTKFHNLSFCESNGGHLAILTRFWFGNGPPGN